MKVDVKKVVDLMKTERLILGVDLTGVEHIGTSPENIVRCTLYDDLGVFVPRVNSEFSLKENNISEIINSFNGDLWVLDDRFLDTNLVKRYFAASEPNKLLWYNPKAK